GHRRTARRRRECVARAPRAGSRRPARPHRERLARHAAARHVRAVLGGRAARARRVPGGAAVKLPGLTRRELLRTAVAAGPARALAAPEGAEEWAPGKRGPLPWRNWSGFQQCVPAQRIGPASEAELCAALRDGSGVLRPAGAGHSFSALVPTSDTLLFLDGLT